MKTETNKVPLVGPRGRRELLDKIEELEKKVIELTQAGGSVPKPIVITDIPSDGDTLQDVFDFGLTLEEIEAAAQGKRTGVVYNGIFYMITYAKFANADSWGISFEFYYRDDDTTIILAENCSLWYKDGSIVIKNSEP